MEINGDSINYPQKVKWYNNKQTKTNKLKGLKTICSDFSSDHESPDNRSLNSSVDFAETVGSFNLLQSLTVLLKNVFFFVHACLAKFNFKAVRVVSVLHTALQCSGSCCHSRSRRLPHNGIISGLFIYFSRRCSTHRKLRRKFTKNRRLPHRLNLWTYAIVD